MVMLRLALGLGALLAACGTAPPTTRPDQVRLETQPPAPSLARWFRVTKRPVIGPRDAKGDSVAVLGGRRVILRKDGSVTLERPETARPIDDAVFVPTSAGPVLVALSDADLVTFPDPLGEGKVLQTFTTRASLVGPLPGAVMVQAGDKQIFDIATGEPRPIETFSPLEPSEVAFLDEQRGVADFDLGELWTKDGGRTWDAGRYGRRSEDVQAFWRGSTPYRANGEVWSFASADGKGPPTRDWLVRHGDPLVAAIEDGIPADDGLAYVASEGTLAQVELRTGRVVETLELATTPLGSCELTRSAEGVLLAVCSSYYAKGEDVLAWVDTANGGMRLLEVKKVRSEGGMKTGRGGGVLFDDPCSTSANDNGSVCVLQPDGNFASLAGAYWAKYFPRPDGTALYAGFEDRRDDPLGEVFLIVGSVSTGGPTEIARVPVQASSAAVRRNNDGRSIGFVDRTRPLFAVTSDLGTEIFELRGNQLVLDRKLACTSADARGGAFACTGPEGAFLRGPEDADYRKLTFEPTGGIAISPLGMRTHSSVHIGLREIAELPREPARSSPEEPERWVGKLTCTTQSPAKEVKPLAPQRRDAYPEFTLPDGWFGVESGGDAVALRIEGTGKTTKWRVRWQSIPMQPEVLEARLDAPFDDKPQLGAVAVHRGTLALDVWTTGQGYVIGARKGTATATKTTNQRRASAVYAGHDGTVAWNDYPETFIALPGKLGSAAFAPSLASLSTPSSEGVWVVFGSGAFEAKPGGPKELTPSLFQPQLSGRALERKLPELTTCPKGARGRTFELSSLSMQVLVDGERQRGRVGSAEVLLDHASPCLAVIDSSAVAADFLDGVAREKLRGRIRDLQCTWGPPDPGN